ncbi:hypothetical protein ACIXRX_21475 [Bacteroides fragilis]|jgi:hypothetical protein
MALTNLTFSKHGEAYVSDPVQLQSDAGLHLEFTSEDKNNRCALFQSMTNVNYVPFGSYNNVGSTIDVAITGVIPGMYIKVQSISQPTLAKILVSE